MPAVDVRTCLHCGLELDPKKRCCSHCSWLVCPNCKACNSRTNHTHAVHQSAQLGVRIPIRFGERCYQTRPKPVE